jgi:formamidopyrimidine-DNA glycosylase
VVRVPELPEVEVKRKYIEETSLGRVIDRVAAKKTRILRNVTPAKLSRDLKGQKFVEARRRAKYLLIATSEGDTLLMHFGMTGDAVFRSKGEAVPKFDKVEFHFSDGNALDFTDIRLFGRIALYETTDEREIPDVSGLGPEPLDRSFTFAKFSAIVRSHNTTIHQLLMEQQLIAGIGNIYSDEITYQAGVLPYRKTGDLKDAEVRAIYDKMKWTLRRAIALNADLDDHGDVFLIPHRVKSGECPHGHPLHKKTIAARSSYYCTVEQK